MRLKTENGISFSLVKANKKTSKGYFLSYGDGLVILFSTNLKALILKINDEIGPFCTKIIENVKKKGNREC